MIVRINLVMFMGIYRFLFFMSSVNLIVVNDVCIFDWRIVLLFIFVCRFIVELKYGFHCA